MGEIFRNLVNMSIAASWLILAVMGLRLVMKKAPKWTRCLLWAMVAVRLICPFSFESALSLVPSSETLPQKVMTGPSYRIDTGVQPVDTAVNGYLGDRYFEGVTVPAHNGSHVMNVLGAVWLLGLLILALYGLVSYGRLRRDVREAVPLRDRVWICDEINTPFILGILRPRIYLPSDLISAQPPHVLPHVLAHEQAHLKRHDHWWKPLGFTLLAVYWFNPLVWAAYILLCRDIELACDEKVIRDFGMEERKAYSDALLSCSLSRRRIMACPLAFGEVGVKERIRSVLKYRKPAFGIVIGAVLICVVMGGCFLTNPKSDTEATNAGTSEADADHTAASAGAEPVIDGQEDTRTALTLDAVVELSKKGEDLGWEDFEPYEYTDIGSGMYIRAYEINSVFSLMIGGGSTSESPTYIYLTHNETGEKTDIRRENVYGFISMYKEELRDQAISSAILSHAVRNASGGLIYVESHVILDMASQGSSDHRDQLFERTEQIYLLAEYQAYSTYGGELTQEGGGYLPIALTFQVVNGAYRLTEYWEPGVGEDYAGDIRDKFPDSCAEDAIIGDQYKEQLQEECRKKAEMLLESGGSIDRDIAGLLDAIESSPLSSSNPADYIQSHQEEYDTLISYGDQTLHYIFGQFLAGGQTGLRGLIMQTALDELAPESRLSLQAENGQAYFEAWAQEAERQAEEIGMEELEKYYPAAWLYMQIRS